MKNWLANTLTRFLGRKPVQEALLPLRKSRGSITHIIILDGTLSRIDPGFETNAGLTYRLLREAAATNHITLYYEPGLQWQGWRGAIKLLTGSGLADQIRRAYGVLASRYRPGDRIILMGYSRGAYAVRSLAGAIDLVGLVRAGDATERNIRQLWRLYRDAPTSKTAKSFAKAYCHETAPIEMVGVWDTVKSLGIVMPLFWRLSQSTYDFHNDKLGASIKNGFQALALDERRVAFSPVMWDCPDNWGGHMEQVWFRGTHGDIGGHVGDENDGRGLSNIPLNWMLERLQMCGVVMPEGWRKRFVQDISAPSIGMNRGFGKMFVVRRRRIVRRDPSETIHASVKIGVVEPDKSSSLWHRFSRQSRP